MPLIVKAHLLSPWNKVNFSQSDTCDFSMSLTFWMGVKWVNCGMKHIWQGNVWGLL